MATPTTVADIPQQTSVVSTDKIFTVKADGVSRLSTIDAVKAAIGSTGGSTTLSNTGVTAGSYTAANLTIAADGRITAAANGATPSGQATLSNTGVTAGTYNYATLTVAADGRLSAASSGTPPTTTIPASGVTAGNYTNANITIGSDGRVTAASNGSAGSGGTTAPLASTTVSGTVKLDAAAADPLVYLKASVDAAFVAKANLDLGTKKLIVSATKPDGTTGSYIWYDTVSNSYWANTGATWIGAFEQLVRLGLNNASASNNNYFNTQLWANLDATCYISGADLAFQDYTGFVAGTTSWKAQLLYISSGGAETILQEVELAPGGTGWNNSRITVAKIIPVNAKLWGIRILKVGTPGNIGAGSLNFITRPYLP